MDNLGTIKTEFNRAYIYLNPDPFTGPPTWRLSNVVPGGSSAQGGLKDIYTLLPIDKTEAGTTTNLFFNIAGLPTTRTVTTREDYFGSIIGTFLSKADLLPRRTNFSLNGLKGIDPIKTVVKDGTGIVYFDVSDLPSLEDARRHRAYNISPSTFKYNSRSVDVLTADDPIQAVTASQTATVSIDFRNLPEA